MPRHYGSGWDEQPLEARRDDETGFKRVRDGTGLKRERIQEGPGMSRLGAPDAAENVAMQPRSTHSGGAVNRRVAVRRPSPWVTVAA